MIGWVIYNGNLKSDKIYELVEWLCKTGEEYGLQMKAIQNSDLLFYLDEKARPHLEFEDKQPDFVISWDKDIPLAKHLESMGIRVYNTAEGIHACDNKVLMLQYLAGKNIPIPKTITAPMVYSNCEIVEYSIYDKIIDTLGLPLVIKEAYGSFGAQVYLVYNKKDLLDQVKTIGHRPHLFQEYIEDSHGKDVRINIVGDQVVASMKRTNDNDFRANITNGGHAEPYEPSEEEKSLALRCSQLLDLDFSGVDLLFGKNGPLLCEINGNPHFKSIYECTGIDVSKSMIEYILKDLKC